MSKTALKRGTGAVVGELPEPHPLLKEPIPHAYALVPCKDRPGLFYAVHLVNVTADQANYLEPSGRPEKPVFGLNRMVRAQEDRHYRRTWSKP